LRHHDLEHDVGVADQTDDFTIFDDRGA
jgi:hypothetical protein